MAWISNSKSSITLLPASSFEFPWFAFLILEVEEENEEVVRLWKELIKELNKEDSYLDKSLKNAANNLKVQAPVSNSLSIYRWCQQMLDTPVEHPLMVLFAQKFFGYYVARPPPTEE